MLWQNSGSSSRKASEDLFKGGLMNNLRFLVAAYVIFWLLPFGLIVSIWVRQRRINREIEALCRRVRNGRDSDVHSASASE